MKKTYSANYLYRQGMSQYMWMFANQYRDIKNLPISASLAVQELVKQLVGDVTTFKVHEATEASTWFSYQDEHGDDHAVFVTTDAVKFMCNGVTYDTKQAVVVVYDESIMDGIAYDEPTTKIFVDDKHENKSVVEFFANITEKLGTDKYAVVMPSRYVLLNCGAEV